MKVTREFKANFTAWGFFFLSVFVFVVIMALFLFSVDTTLAWIVKLLTGRVES